MALYDERIALLKRHALLPSQQPDIAAVIHGLQEIVRCYNPDDAIFDDEKKAVVRAEQQAVERGYP